MKTHTSLFGHSMCRQKTPQERGGQTSAFCSAQTDSSQQEPSNHQRKETAPPPRNPYL